MSGPEMSVVVLAVVWLLVMVFAAIVCYYVLPKRRNIQLFRPDELKEFGGKITVGDRTVRVKAMSSVTVGAYSVTIHQDGDMIKMTFNMRTPIVVEVYR